MELGMLLKALFAFVSLLILTRLLGKKLISQLTFFDYIVGISIGNIAGSLSINKNQDFISAIQGLLVWSVIPLILDWLSRNFYWVRQLLNGKPTVVIEQGKILQNNLQREHMTVNDMMQLLREKNIFNLTHVEFAILETNGKISVMKKTEDQPLSPRTTGMLVVNEGEPRIIVMDGNVMERTLQYVGYSKEWLLGELMKQGAGSFSDVFLAQIDAKGNLYVDLYDDDIEQSKIKARPLVAAMLKKVQADMENFALETKDPDAKDAYKNDAASIQQLIDQMEPYLRE